MIDMQPCANTWGKCNNTFTPRTHGRRQLFCSSRCRDQAHNHRARPSRAEPPPPELKCANPMRKCPNRFVPHVRNRHQVYCSAWCNRDAQKWAAKSGYREKPATPREEQELAPIRRREEARAAEVARTDAQVSAARATSAQRWFSLLGVA